jgi:hypothetical protein
VFDGGRFASSYRVRDGRITVVNRSFGGRNMTITVLEEATNAESKQLPQSYTAQYWDGRDGSLAKSESFAHRWTRVGGFDLPAAITVTSASKSGLSVRRLELKNHKLAAPRKPK